MNFIHKNVAGCGSSYIFDLSAHSDSSLRCDSSIPTSDDHHLHYVIFLHFFSSIFPLTIFLLSLQRNRATTNSLKQITRGFNFPISQQHKAKPRTRA
ncbi:hypothetical protein RchiOBHm_Chr2g0088531 [Rosa chinensis]|uniref:Uncharacterized protein n=1 Tax=Rosa chinensis TaxID=74649 RepID=A0A2P6RIY1_ROSCH|nr:hypothetical protein RchiOBHm_Chr2g0088531 [Rosa chinensis]